MVEEQAHNEREYWHSGGKVGSITEKLSFQALIRFLDRLAVVDGSVRWQAQTITRHNVPISAGSP